MVDRRSLLIGQGPEAFIGVALSLAASLRNGGHLILSGSIRTVAVAPRRGTQAAAAERPARHHREGNGRRPGIKGHIAIAIGQHGAAWIRDGSQFILARANRRDVGVGPGRPNRRRRSSEKQCAVDQLIGIRENLAVHRHRRQRGGLKSTRAGRHGDDLIVKRDGPTDRVSDGRHFSLIVGIVGERDHVAVRRVDRTDLKDRHPCRREIRVGRREGIDGAIG